jgi:predicted Fe-Mo cluster-binding NifX family protein
MRIAIPSDDKTTISGHTGRCAGFLIYAIEDQQAKQEDYRQNTAGHAHHHTSGEHEEHHHHDHHAMIELLNDCDAVVAVGMGPRLINDLEIAGIKIYFTYESNAATAANLLAHGQLINDQPRSRCCQH